MQSSRGLACWKKRPSISIERVMLRVPSAGNNRRAQLLEMFQTDSTGKDAIFGVEWAIENNPTANGIRCNANIVIGSVGARIPNSNNPANPTVIDTVLVFPKEVQGSWGNKYLTTSHVTYKGGDRVLFSEPSKMKIGKFYEYLPKEVHDTPNTIAEKLVADKIGDNPNLIKRHVVVKWVTMRCNLSLDNRGDIEEHSSYTHGVDINRLDTESKIEVNESDTLILAPAKNICELPDEQRKQVIDS